MAREMLVRDDITGEVAEESSVRPFDYTHPVSGTVFELLTTEENFNKFIADMSTAMAELTKAEEAAQTAYDAAVAKAEEARRKALEKTQAKVVTALETASKNVAKWEPKKRFGKAVTSGGSKGSGDPVAKARSEFIKSEQSIALAGGNKTIKAEILNRREKTRGKLSDTLMDWLILPEILTEWHPDHVKREGAEATA